MRPAGLAELDVPVLLDGAQGVGAIPIDVRALGCAFYAGSGQKWLCGPIGTGMLWVAPGRREDVLPIGATYMNLAEPRATASSPRCIPTPAATTPPALSAEAAAAAVAAHDVLAEAGLGRGPRARERRSRRRSPTACRERGRTVAPRGETTLVSWEDDDPEATRDRLAAAGIVVRNLPGTPYVRASVGAWNDERDLDRLLDAAAPV